MSNNAPEFDPNAQPLEPSNPPVSTSPVVKEQKQVIKQQYIIIIALAVVLMCSVCSLVLVIGAAGDNDQEQAAAPQPQAGNVEGQAGAGAIEAADEQVEQVQSADEPESTRGPRPTATPRPRPSATPAPVGYSIENPAGTNQVVTVPNYEFTLLGSRLPVDEELLDYSFLNVPSQETLEFLRVTVRVTCRVEECDFWPGGFDVQAASGIIYEYRAVLFTVDGLLDSTELLQGTTVSGDIYFEVPKTESGLTLRWEPWIGDNAYFDLPY